MRQFDWIDLLSLAGAAALAVGFFMKLSPALLIFSAVALLLAVIALNATRRARMNELQRRCDELYNRLEQQRDAHSQELSQLKTEQETARSAFYSEISHSLRMPISVIQGYAELMQTGALDQVRVSEYLDRILHHTHRMIDVLSSKFSLPLEDNSPSLSQKQVDLVLLVQNQIKDLQRTAADNGISLQLVCSQDSLPVLADKRLLQRIFFNLVENSMKYMGREGIVTVILTHDDTVARVNVRDDGMGLPETEVSRIFDSHFRGSNSTPGSGSGYGLFLVKQAVEAQGGTVHATSHPGQGMSITFTLPLAPGSEEKK